MSPTSGAAISTFESISLGSMSIWMNFFDPGSPQVLPLPCDRSQLRRAPISITTSASFSTVERAAPADSGCVSGKSPFAMLIGRNGMPLFSIRARIVVIGLRIGRALAEDDQRALGALQHVERALDGARGRESGPAPGR